MSVLLLAVETDKYLPDVTCRMEILCKNSAFVFVHDYNWNNQVMRTRERKHADIYIYISQTYK